MRAFEPFLDGYCNVHTQLYEHLRDRNLNAVWDHIRAKEALTTADDVVPAHITFVRPFSTRWAAFRRPRNL